MRQLAACSSVRRMSVSRVSAVAGSVAASSAMLKKRLSDGIYPPYFFRKVFNNIALELDHHFKVLIRNYLHVKY